MADIVVFDTDKTGEKAQRLSGMEKLGEVFNKNFQKGGLPDEEVALTDDEIVNNTIREIIKLGPRFIVTYLDRANVLSVKSKKRNKYFFNPPGTPEAVLTLRAVRDKEEETDGHEADVMNIALPKGHDSLLIAGNYLSKVITDLDAEDRQSNRKYLLGTITFRRCR
jgi:hypothetical protein